MRNPSEKSLPPLYVSLARLPHMSLLHGSLICPLICPLYVTQLGGPPSDSALGRATIVATRLFHASSRLLTGVSADVRHASTRRRVFAFAACSLLLVPCLPMHRLMLPLHIFFVGVFFAGVFSLLMSSLLVVAPWACRCVLVPLSARLSLVRVLDES